MTSEMSSRPVPSEAFVWCWPPEHSSPVVVGRLYRDGLAFSFHYARSWLAREDAFALYEPELPLRPGPIRPRSGMDMASCLRDASPDAWGRRVLLNRMNHPGALSQDDPDELWFLLHSGSDRPGALDFQESPRVYVSRGGEGASLADLQQAAFCVERGDPVPPDLDRALFHGSSIGGARPKALIEAPGRKMIAKFSSSTDTFSMVKVEYVAMRLARLAGLSAASVALEEAAGRDVLLVERFDRVWQGGWWARRPVVSALTLLGLSEMEARYAHYGDLADLVRARFTHPLETLHELFRRMVFNVLCGNTDDHARNHGAFCERGRLGLTPAYDICPQVRTGGEATQAMLIVGEERSSRLATCLKASPRFLVSTEEARTMIRQMVSTIQTHWDEVCQEGRVSSSDRARLWGRQFLNPYAFEGWDEG